MKLVNASMYVYGDEAKDTMLLEFEEILCGKRKSFSNYYFTDSKERNHEIAICTLRYLFHNILGWDLAQAKSNLTLALFKKYKLDKVLSVRIVFPDAPTGRFRIRKGDIHPLDKVYLLHLIYPEYKVDIRESTVSMLKDILNGEEKKFPKEYWNAYKGKIRACICMQYMLSELKLFRGVRDMYELFASEKAEMLLGKYKLQQACNIAFAGDALRYLHESLPGRMADEMLYQEFVEARKNRIALAKKLAEEKRAETERLKSGIDVHEQPEEEFVQTEINLDGGNANET